MSTAEGHFSRNHEEEIVAVQSSTMKAFAEDVAEVCLRRAGQKETQPQRQVRYPAVDAGHPEDF